MVRTYIMGIDPRPWDDKSLYTTGFIEIVNEEEKRIYRLGRFSILKTNYWNFYCSLPDLIERNIDQGFGEVKLFDPWEPV
jgi:hypothetical protein